MLVIDSTQAKCFSNCKRRFYWNYVEQLRKSEYEEDSVDLRFGQAIHSALELYGEKTTDTAPVLEKFRSEFVDLPGEQVKTAEHGVKLLEAFFPYYKANFSEWETLQTEEVGHITIGGNIDYVCKIDRVIRWRGNVYCVDWKTTKSTRKAGFFDKFALDFQPTGYIKWCKEKYGECSGFIPVGMFLGYRSRAYKGEPAGFHCDFDYTIVNRTQEDIDAFEADLLMIEDEMEQATTTNKWRRNPDYCSSYKGCQYSQLCQSNDDPMVVESLYEKFDATKYLGVL